MKKINFTRREVKDILIALNSTDSFFKYPIGNSDLTEKVKLLESANRIKFNSLTNRWEKS